MQGGSVPLGRALLALLVCWTLGRSAGAQDVPPAAAAPQEPAPQAAPEAPPEPIVTRVLVEGNQRYSSAQLRSALGQEVGAPRDRDAIQRGIGTLWTVFHVRAEVKEREVPDDTPDDGRVAIELLLHVDELPLDLEPRFTGNKDIDTKKIREWAGLQDDAELFLYQAPRIRERILQGYHDKGYCFAEVKVVEREAGVDQETGKPVAPDVIFQIQEGPQVRVSRVVLEGNHALGNHGFWPLRRGLSKLASAELHGPRFFGLFASKFVQETLDADVIAMREVYRDYGYLDAVVQVSHLEFSADREWVTIHVAVDEGPQYHVGSVDLEAVRLVQEDQGARIQPATLVIPEDELRKLLHLEKGDVFRRNVVDDDESALRDRYGEEGYIDHPSLPLEDRWRFLDPLLTYEPDQPIVHVTYRIAQGRQQFIREVKIRGNLNTQDRVVRRLITVEPGQVADPKEIQRSRDRLQASGYFSNPRNPVQHSEPTYRFVPTEDPNWKDLEYIVEEGEVLTFEFSGGVSSNSGAFGLFSVSHRNFDLTDLPSSPWNLIGEVLDRQAFYGAGQELTLQASPGTQRSYYSLYFLEPDIFRRHQNRISLSLTGQEYQRRYRTHDEDRRFAGFRLGHQIGADSQVYAGYNLGEIDVSNISTGGEPRLSSPLAVPPTLRDEQGTSGLGWIDLGFSQQVIDDRIDPHNGHTLSVRTSIYDKSLGSDFEFLKTEVGFDFYDEIGDDTRAVGDRYHIGLDGGVAVPYGSTSDVPYSERFFLGGQSSLRGFDYRGVGPNRQGVPFGGETYLKGTAEYRLPLVTTTQPGTYRQIETMHFGFFVDVGVLDPSEFQLDFGETRASAGILFGFGVPLPITFSLGFPLIKGDGDRTQVLGFTIGTR